MAVRYENIPGVPGAVRAIKETPVSLNIPKARSELQIAGMGGLGFRLPCKIPNRWWRFWQWLLLGFRWRKIE